MAKYPKRQKVKRYRRSFYSREMRVKKGIGIAVLVLVMLGAAWLAAPHVLDWATHTWYTVVRNRDLSASSPASASASSVAESPASSAASEPAASSEAQPEVVTPAVDGTAIVDGSWAEADITALTEDASIRAAAQQLASQGVKYAVVTLKDATGVVYYASQVPAAAASPASVTVDPARVAAIFREEGLIPVAKLAAFRDPAGARADHAMAIGYKGQAYLWLDNKASADGKPWLNPYADAAVQYIGDLIDELHTAGFEQMVLENVQFPASTSSKQDYGTTNGVSRADPAAGRYGGLGAALWQPCDPVVQLYAGRGGRHLQHAGRPGGTAGREEPCGAGAFGLHHDRRGARCSGAGADRSGRRACGRAGQCGRILRIKTTVSFQ